MLCPHAFVICFFRSLSSPAKRRKRHLIQVSVYVSFITDASAKDWDIASSDLDDSDSVNN